MSAGDFNMSKTCPLSTAVEFKACACALLDVFHTVIGKRTPQRHHDDYFARTAGEPRPRPSAPGCIHRVRRMPHRSVISPTEHRFWPISNFLSSQVTA